MFPSIKRSDIEISSKRASPEIVKLQKQLLRQTQPNMPNDLDKISEQHMLKTIVPEQLERLSN